MDQNKPTVIGALRVVNAARRELGLPELTEMPDGNRQESTDCPVFHGLTNGHAIEVNGPYVFINTKEGAEALMRAWNTGLRLFGSEESTDCDHPNALKRSDTEWPRRFAVIRPEEFEPWGSGEEEDSIWGYEVRAPLEIRRFVREFDAGMLHGGFDA